MKLLAAAAFILASSLAHAQGAAGHGVIVINTPDGPTLETRREIGRARQGGANSVTVMLENVDLVQDEELLKLIELEIVGILKDSGFPEEGIAFERCPEACKR